MKNIYYLGILIILIFQTTQIKINGQSENQINQKIDKLLSEMTLKEKIGQLQQLAFGENEISEEIYSEVKAGNVGSFLNANNPEITNALQKIAVEESRLGIPIIFARDVIHGYRTMFPIPLAQGCSWNPDLIKEASRIAAIEASSHGIRWTFAPMMDMTRDPRWGRIAETTGEDAYLTSILTSAMIEGFQGKDLKDPTSIAACAKHYVGYGAAEGGRDYNTTLIPERELRDYYLKPFKAANDVKAQTFMSAFNDLNGIPASGNKYTIREILKDEWKFDGFVVSDWASMTEMIAHTYCKDEKEVAKKSMFAGVDMEMVSQAYTHELQALVESGDVDIKLVDDAVRRILRVKFRLGLFENPYVDTEMESPILKNEFKEVSRELAAQSMVLLKNNDDFLPLSMDVKSVAVIGPLADAGYDQIGMWSLDGRGEESVTPLAAITEFLGKEKINYAAGLEKCRTLDKTGFPKAIEAAENSEVVMIFLGEDQLLSGEAHSRAFLDLPGIQSELLDEIAKVNKNIVLILMAGRPLTFSEEAEDSKAVLWAWHSGTMAGPATIDLLFGKKNPSGKLCVTFPRTVGQIPIYYNHKNTGRPPSADMLGIEMGTPEDPKGFVSNYLDVDFTPQYPFGFGLSYNDYEYSNLMLSSNEIIMNEKLEVEIEVKNNGRFVGTEIVQLYIRDLFGNVTRPVKELKNFERITLNPGESKIVKFTLYSNDLAFYNENMEFKAEPGDFKIWVGGNSESGIEKSFTLK